MRVFPINNRLASFLKSIQPVERSGEAKVFPSPEGKWIDVQNLGRRAWKGILETLDDVEYRLSLPNSTYIYYDGFEEWGRRERFSQNGR